MAVITSYFEVLCFGLVHFIDYKGPFCLRCLFELVVCSFVNLLCFFELRFKMYDELLITLVEQCPHLYNRALKDYTFCLFVADIIYSKKNKGTLST